MFTEANRARRTKINLHLLASLFISSKGLHSLARAVHISSGLSHPASKVTLSLSFVSYLVFFSFGVVLILFTLKRQKFGLKGGIDFLEFQRFLPWSSHNISEISTLCTVLLKKKESTQCQDYLTDQSRSPNCRQ